MYMDMNDKTSKTKKKVKNFIRRIGIKVVICVNKK